MCWCDKYDVTVNRADNVMLAKVNPETYNAEGKWWEITPDCLWQLIEMGLASGFLKEKQIVDEIWEVLGPEEE